MLRTCIGCRKKEEKNNLIRIVKNENGVQLDIAGRKDGRGAYICNSQECLDKAIKQRALNRTFKYNVLESDIAKIKGEFLANKQN